ncbi:hypothetical protein ACTTAF_10825 [Rhodobacter capsulatus]|uniref:hypothetical protein n=1 Tax=Rhodobacter capsulatus TaxID=1061 RepID=UPI004038CE8B
MESADIASLTTTAVKGLTSAQIAALSDAQAGGADLDPDRLALDRGGQGAQHGRHGGADHGRSAGADLGPDRRAQLVADPRHDHGADRGAWHGADQGSDGKQHSWP